jgi:hypothetical protein
VEVQDAQRSFTSGRPPAHTVGVEASVQVAMTIAKRNIRGGGRYLGGSFLLVEDDQPRVSATSVAEGPAGPSPSPLEAGVPHLGRCYNYR